MPDAQLSELARATADGVLVALGAGAGVEDWAEAGAWIMRGLVDFLVEGEGVARGLKRAIAEALGAGIDDEGGGVEPGGGFGRKTLRRRRTLRR